MDRWTVQEWTVVVELSFMNGYSLIANIHRSHLPIPSRIAITTINTKPNRYKHIRKISNNPMSITQEVAW